MSGCHVPLTSQDVKYRELEIENIILKQQIERLKDLISQMLTIL